MQQSITQCFVSLDMSYAKKFNYDIPDYYSLYEFQICRPKEINMDDSTVHHLSMWHHFSVFNLCKHCKGIERISIHNVKEKTKIEDSLSMYQDKLIVMLLLLCTMAMLQLEHLEIELCN